jgi:glucokinase
MGTEDSNRSFQERQDWLSLGLMNVSAPRLLVDLGGTNVRCALQRAAGPAEQVVKMKVAEHTGLAAALAAYLDTAEGPRPASAAVAVAAPVTGDKVELTNASWAFSRKGLRDELQLESLHIVNDFTAIAMGLPDLGGEHLLAVGGGKAVAGAPMGVLGPGTGLGVSGLLPVGDRWLALAGEGGHVTLPATDEREAGIIALLRGEEGHVSAERLISGSGLVNLYQALCMLSGVPAPELKPDEISHRASGGDPLAHDAVTLFFSFLGTVAGNLALTLGAFGGIYIAGGIAPRLKDVFVASPFRAKFEAKGRYSDYMADIPTWLVLDDVPAFRGLAAILDGHRYEG